MKFQKRTTVDPEIINNLSKTCKISPLLSELLAIRNIVDYDHAKKFLFGKIEDLNSPFIFPDMQIIVDTIKKAIFNNKKIFLYGDYDCDGVGAIAIFTLAMRDYGYHVDHYIPTRANEGYGMNTDAIKYIAEKYSPDLLITVDCGINSIKEVDYAKSLGMDVIVTDHHTPSEILPNCHILNPFLAKGASPLCGAGVVFTLIRALFGEKIAFKYIDICTVSTVADIVPLVDDNRLIVKFGLETIRKGRCRPGIKEILYSSKTDIRTINTGDIGYKIAPRINAAGRLKSAELSLNLLLEDDPTSLHMIADELSMLNAERQEMNSKIYDEVMERLKSYDFSKYKVIMLKGEWNEGVVGIVCAKIVEYFHLPTILLCKQDNNILKGSARSIAGVNLYELFDKNCEKLISYGGHEMAAGISLNEDDYLAILEQFNNYIITNSDARIFERRSYYDANLNIKEINPAILSEINLLEPFGHKNNSPVFHDSEPKLKFKQIGSSKHIKAQCGIGDAVAFDKINYVDLLKNNAYDITYVIDKNNFNGKIYTQFIIKDIDLKTNNFSKIDILENFCKTFIKANRIIIEKNPIISSNKKPTLICSFDQHNAIKVIKSHPEYNVEIFNQNGCSLTDTIVISPSRDYPYSYYSEIIFLEKIGNNFVDYISKCGKNVSYSDTKINLEKVNVEYLRDLYVDIKKGIIPNKKFLSAKKLFEEFYPYGINDEKRIEKFLIGFYILMELGLIIVNKDDIIEIINKKTEITKSSLYGYVNG